jgi:predicted dehydrogenase
MTTMNDEPVAVGVVGVGSMGQHHARVYESLPEANLVGVADADADRAAEIAAQYGTAAYDLEGLLDRVEAVTIAVPTQYHLDIASTCLEAGVDVLIEKPIASSVSEAEQLIDLAEANDRILQVGHIERFNPAVETLQEFIDELDVVSVTAKRLGPPPKRHIDDSAVLDLMIHDIDVVLSLLNETPQTVTGASVKQNRHATATMTFDSNTVANLTASRLTQKKIRTLDIVAEECLVQVDYMSKDVEIHRQSRPEYITDDADIHYRHESLVERPMVDSTEPLANELSAFLEAVEKRTKPVVDGEDGLQALHLAKQIDQYRVENADAVDEEFTLGASEVGLD